MKNLKLYHEFNIDSQQWECMVTTEINGITKVSAFNIPPWMDVNEFCKSLQSVFRALNEANEQESSQK